MRHAPEADPMRMHRVWIDGPFEGGSMVELHGGEVRRARKVLRLRQGDLVTVVQAGGVEGEAEVVELCPQRVVLRVRRVWEADRESPLWIRLFQALPKADRMEWVVQKATELGVQEMGVLLTRRCVPQWGPEGSHGRMKRWRRIIQEAARQCGRAWIPSLAGPWNLGDLCRDEAGQEALKLVLWEGERATGLREALGRGAPPGMRVSLVVGPEGGLEEEEVTRLEEAGFVAVKMGPRILRTETAGPMAAAVLQYVFGDLG